MTTQEVKEKDDKKIWF